MTYSDQKLLDEKLSEFFHGELPRPFPVAPQVFFPKARSSQSHSTASRLALAACLIILAGLAIFWPRHSDGISSDDPMRSRPASASDDKRHLLPFLTPKEASNPPAPGR